MSLYEGRNISDINGWDGRNSRGVRGDEGQREGAALFFQVWKRKWRNVLKLNLEFILFSIPVMIVLMLIVSLVANYVLNLDSVNSMLLEIASVKETPVGWGGFVRYDFTNTTPDMVQYLSLQKSIGLMIMGFLTVTFLLVFGSGPASCAIYAIHDCFMRSESVFIFSDYFDSLRKHLKKGSMITSIDLCLFLLFILSFLMHDRVNILVDIRILSSVILGFNAMLHIYLYPLLVKYDVHLSLLYKTAIILAFKKLPRTILLIVVWLFVAGLTSYMICLNPNFAALFAVLYIFGVLIFGFGYTSLMAAVNCRTVTEGFREDFVIQAD